MVRIAIRMKRWMKETSDLVPDTDVTYSKNRVG